MQSDFDRCLGSFFLSLSFEILIRKVKGKYRSLNNKAWSNRSVLPLLDLLMYYTWLWYACVSFKKHFLFLSIAIVTSCASDTHTTSLLIPFKASDERGRANAYFNVGVVCVATRCELQTLSSRKCVIAVLWMEICTSTDPHDS